MSFDDEVDAARRRLERALSEETAPKTSLAALQELAPKLREKISSRRLQFALADDDAEDLGIAILHTDTEEELGVIYVEDGEYIFESSVEGYFDDFVDEDADSFLERLYETLRADLAKYELEAED